VEKSCPNSTTERGENKKKQRWGGGGKKIREIEIVLCCDGRKEGHAWRKKTQKWGSRTVERPLNGDKKGSPKGGSR